MPGTFPPVSTEDKRTGREGPVVHTREQKVELRVNMKV